MSKLTIIRGLPGSGKSTLAKTYPCLVVEADMFFQRNGQYVFNANHIRDAHSHCQSVVRMGLAWGADVVVANTFTTLKEMRPYLDMTWDSLEVIKCVGEYGSVHNVPEDTIKKMKQRWQDYEGEITYEAPTEN